jgi:hypothetical protein
VDLITHEIYTAGIIKTLNIGGWNTYGRLREEISNSVLDFSGSNEA